MGFTIEPVEGESYEGRQIGYTILLLDGRPYLHVETGGTGTCWNIHNFDLLLPKEEESETLHVCELADFIAALETLRDSEAHAKHLARWA